MTNAKAVTDPTQPVAASVGLGAWYKHNNHWYYQQGDGALGTNPADIDVFVNNAIIGLKACLAVEGFAGKMSLASGTFGAGMTRNVKRFQAQAFGGDVSQMDGVIGPHTAKALLLPIIRGYQLAQHIPNDYLAKLVSQESGFDPGAQGSRTPLDRGANQISLFYHPDISNLQAMNPTFSIPYGGHLLVSNFGSTHDWDGALAAYNIGLVRAIDWVKHGKPATGLLAGSFDYAAAATAYVQRVKAQVV